jgi:hypothetical protein
MRRSGLIWGAVLVILGLVLLVDNLGLLDSLGINLWDMIWPLLLILFGVWILWGAFGRQRTLESEQVTIPAEGASQAEIRFNHGAGRLLIAAGASADNLVEGSFAGGLEHKTSRAGEALKVDLSVPTDRMWFFPFYWGPRSGYEWKVDLSRDVRLSLDLRTGASETRLDLSDLLVTDLRIQTGASSTELTLPTNAGYTRAEIKSGAASVAITVPPNVAARIQARGGLADFNWDRQRFTRSGDIYQSADYESAANRAEIFVETGVGSVKIR